RVVRSFVHSFFFTSIRVAVMGSREKLRDSPSSTPVLQRCPICWVKKVKDQLQGLPCGHHFCEQCVSATTTGSGASIAYLSFSKYTISSASGFLCPDVYCSESRCMELIIDEMAEGEQKYITLGGGSGVNVSVLNLEDCTKCDCLKGAFSCPNRARLEIANCRHMMCFDCIEERIDLAVTTKERPNCPIAMCSNLLTKGEVSKLMWRSPKMIDMCRNISHLFPEKEELEELSKDDLLVTSSIYGHDSTIKAILVPMNALVGDMVTACLQLQRMTKNRMTSSLGIFIRTPTTKGRAVYDQVDLKELSKAQVKDQGWPQRLQLVIDVDERLKKAHKSKSWKSGQ
ncbi:hypothetical protein PFISCL1PPCAC_15655, partial [Pristionchus fissidentatus]